MSRHQYPNRGCQGYKVHRWLGICTQDGCTHAVSGDGGQRDFSLARRAGTDTMGSYLLLLYVKPKVQGHILSQHCGWRRLAGAQGAHALACTGWSSLRSRDSVWFPQTALLDVASSAKNLPVHTVTGKHVLCCAALMDMPDTTCKASLDRVAAVDMYSPASLHDVLAPFAPSVLKLVRGTLSKTRVDRGGKAARRTFCANAVRGGRGSLRHAGPGSHTSNHAFATVEVAGELSTGHADRHLQ